MGIFSGILKYFPIYIKYLPKHMYFLFLFSIGVAFMDGIGITFLFPLLGVLEGSGPPDNQVGRLFYDLLSYMGVNESLVAILLLIGGVFVLKGIFTFAEGSYRGYLTAYVMRELKSRMFEAYSKMNYSYYSLKNTGHFTNVINEQINRFFNSFYYFSLTISNILMTIGYLFFAFIVSWELVALSLSLGVVLLISYRFLNKIVHRISRLNATEAGVLNKLLIQVLHAFKYAVSTNQLNHLRTGVLISVQKLARYQMKQEIMRSLTHSIREPLSVMFVLGIVAFQAVVMKVELAPMFVVILLFYRCMGYIFNIQVTWQNTMSEIGSLELVNDEFENLNKNREHGGLNKIPSLKKTITLQNISFSYNKEPVLNKLNMRILANKTVAVVGESGAGKSTLIDMLTLLLKPQSGQIEIDGVPGQEVELASWRKQIGYVLQDTVIFDDTVANNICLWEGDSVNDNDLLNRIKNAAIQAYISEFIETLEDGYETVVGDRGVRLSGGQRQRLFIARELFKQPNLLLLDEATSSLDSESERYLQESIDALKGKMTVLIIAHRLSTIRNVDYIYVLDKGKLVEEGSYRNLRDNKQSRFSKMIEMQVL